MVFTVLTLSQMGHVLVIRSELTPVFSSRFSSNPALLGAVGLTFALQLAVIYVPYFNGIFRTTPLTALELAVCAVASAVVGALVEVEKWFVRRGLIYRH